MTPRDPRDSKTIDDLYGLEPVFEPDSADAANPTEFVAVQCPYCGESFDTTVDVSAGAFSYVEDCQVCCQPIELTSEMNDQGALVGVIARRAD
jgi:hypothetical protein